MGRHRSSFVALRLAGAVALAAVACAGPTGESGNTAASGNLLLVTVDTLRADRLGAYGYDAIETPHVDRLAAEGVRFDRAYTTAPTTLPAHLSLLTGMTPRRHGIRENGGGTLRSSAVTLAERFRDAGFATGGFVGAYVLDARFGVAQGFDVYIGSGGAADGTPAAAEQTERRGDEVVDDAIAWIETRRQRHWFAWVHLFDPHAAYAAPEPFGSRYDAEPYDGEIAWVDALVGRLRGALEGTGAWANTTVVFTADHGEALGAHGEPTHGFFLYEETLRVPLIVRPADAWDGGFTAGATFATPVGLIDVLPTVAELWGLPTSDEVEGRSLVAALRGEELPAVPLYSETILPRSSFGWADLEAVVEGDDKYIEAPRPELYDLRSDPAERDNLASERSERAGELRARLDAWIEATEAAAPAAGVTDSETLASLRSLGYVAGSGVEERHDLPDPKDRIDTYVNLINALAAWRDGDPEGALELLDEEIRADPQLAGAWYYRGLVLASEEDLPGAAEAFDRAWDAHPGHVVAARELARTRQRMGDLPGAVEVLEILLADAPGDVRLRWEVAQFRLLLGDVDGAEATLRTGLESTPAEPQLLLGMALVATRRGDARAALQILDSLVAVAPDLADLQYRRGMALQSLGLTDEAIAAFSAELERQPAHFGATYNRGALYAHQGRNAEAIAAGRAALEIRPDAAEAKLFLAQMLVDSADPGVREEALALAEGAIESVANPRLQAAGHNTLAELYDALGRPQDAEAHRREARRLGGGR
jgi:arylsulfatase A-like enzyme/Tfp pilus assembly protein PilF